MLEQVIIMKTNCTSCVLLTWWQQFDKESYTVCVGWIFAVIRMRVHIIYISQIYKHIDHN